MTKKKIINCNKIMTKEENNKFNKEKKLSEIKKIVAKKYNLKKNLKSSK